MADEYRESTYGDRIAEVYDDSPGVPRDSALAADFLAGLAGGGPALELGIGTGRIALLLRERGVEVHGIDASGAMVAKLRGKPRGAEIPVTIGNFADVAVDRKFRLIYVVFNTFFALLTQEEQVRCFRNVRQRLEDDGAFVIETFVPDVTRFDRGQRVSALRIRDDAVWLDAEIYDPVSQTVRAQHLVVGSQGPRWYPVRLRFAYPPELDLMAQLGGLRLRERWNNWKREPYTATALQVSVYERGD
jgi:SAM-dependent methyltransferase